MTKMSNKVKLQKNREKILLGIPFFYRLPWIQLALGR